MSTNYHWHALEDQPIVVEVEFANGHTATMAVDLDDPAIHICKRTTDQIIWAQQHVLVSKICRDNTWEQIIMDEYGKLYTGSDFLELMEKWRDRGLPYDTRSIGVSFC